MADLRTRQKAAEPVQPAAPVAPEPAPPEARRQPPVAATSSIPERAAPARTGLSFKPRWGLVAAVAILGIAGWFGGQMLAGRTETEVDTVEPVNANAPPEPAGEILNFSVAIESYDQLALAQARADSLAMLDSTLSYYIAPVLVDGDMFFRVLAGPLQDSASAAAAAQSLVDRGWKAAFQAWDVRNTPLAFLLGRFDSREAAVQRMNDLRAQGVPSYIVEVPYTSGPNRFHLYGGAYQADSEAALMRDLLKRAGVLDTLVLRLGRLP